MEFFKWRDSYATGIERIDTQHKQLIDMLNQLYGAYMDKTSKDIIVETISKLKEYTITHFTTEESYMSIYGYPAMAEHKKEHKHFIEQINDFQKQYVLNDNVLTLKIISFLQDWLKTHICSSDHAYVSFFKSKGLK